MPRLGPAAPKPGPYGQALAEADELVAAKGGTKGGGGGADIIEGYVGKDATLTKNAAGDIHIVSKDGTKQVNFHTKNPSPHKNPHAHVVKSKKVKNKMKKVKDVRVYPKDVKPE